MDKVPFQLRHGLVFVPVTLIHHSRSIVLQNCIFDTGAAGTTFEADLVAAIGITASPTSKIKRLATIGGYERVFTHDVDQLSIGEAMVNNIEIEVGDLTSKFAIDGIIGINIIQHFNWMLDFSAKQLMPIMR